MSAHERFTRFTFGSSGSPFLSDSATPQVLTPRNTLESSNRHSEHGAAAAPPAPRQQKPAAAHLAHLAANLSNPVPIARLHISQLTPALFDAKFRQPGVPLVIEGAIDLSSFDWRLHSFVETFDAEATYQCRVHGGDAFARTPSKWSGKSHARHVVPTTPRKYAQTITDGIAAREDCYVQADIRGTRAGEAVEVTLRRLSAATGLQIHRNYGPICNMWWGAPGHTEPLHMDATDGTLCQLHGRKRIVLFPPSSWRDLYPFPSSETGMSWAFSQVVQSKPDLGRFPLLIASDCF